MIHHINFSDIHAVPGNTTPYKFYNDELSEALDYLLESDLDLITIAGDLFDTIYKADSLEVNITMKFIHQLINIAAGKDAKVRFIKGTESHDYDQLKLFENYVDDRRYDVKIFNEPHIEFIENLDLKIKYIPEVIVPDYNKFANEFLSQQSDVTIFHGLIKDVTPIMEKGNKTVIIHPDDLRDYTNLYTVCGHIHERTLIKNDLWYTGSFSTKSYTDADEEKGFDHITIEDNLKDYAVNFVENKNCHKYKIIDATEDFNRLTQDALKAKFYELSRNTKTKEKIRIDVDISKLNETKLRNLEFIQVKFRNTFDFKGYNKDLDSNEEEIQDKVETAQHILDKNIPITDKVIKELKDNKKKFNLESKDIDREKIKKLMGVVEEENN